MTNKTCLNLSRALIVSSLLLSGCGQMKALMSSTADPSQSPSAVETPTINPDGSDSKSSGGKGAFGIKPGLAGRQQVNTDPASKFLVYVPPQYTDDTPMGVVLVFHGVEGTADPIGFFSLLGTQVNNDRFILISPQGEVNNPSSGSGSFSQPYVREIMDKVKLNMNIDYSRQYMVAVSGGVNPALPYAFSSRERVYTNPFGLPMKVGYQSEFAAVGITSPGGGSENMLGGLEFKTAAQLGFTPELYVDYGAQSSNGPSSKVIADWGTARGYKVTMKARPGEGHPPEAPYTFLKEMFDVFEKTVKK